MVAIAVCSTLGVFAACMPIVTPVTGAVSTIGLDYVRPVWTGSFSGGVLQSSWVMLAWFGFAVVGGAAAARKLRVQAAVILGGIWLVAIPVLLVFRQVVPNARDIFAISAVPLAVVFVAAHAFFVWTVCRKQRFVRSG